MYNQIIYLDNNATTKIDEKVLEVMLPYLKENYGNPSSIYSFSKNIKLAIQTARNNIAKLLNASLDEIIFTSCATESNNSAIISAVKNNPAKKHLITSQVEHSSVLETMKYLETIGYEVTYLPVDNFGRIDLVDLKQAIREDTLLISVMFANNEIGNIYPIKEICQIAHEHNILFHVDAVQAIGKFKIDVKELDVDSLSLSGHKIHAPKGVGILYIKKGTPFTNLIFGGHQEQGKRGGTENVASIVGLGKAAELIMDDDYLINDRIKQLRDDLEKQIKENISGVTIYGDQEHRLSNTTNIAFEGIKGEELLMMLEANNIFISTGSACNSSEAMPSHVLVACHVDFTTSSPIRISLGKDNTQEEIDNFIKKLINVINTLRKRV